MFGWPGAQKSRSNGPNEPWEPLKSNDEHPDCKDLLGCHFAKGTVGPQNVSCAVLLKVLVHSAIVVII